MGLYTQIPLKLTSCFAPGLTPPTTGGDVWTTTNQGLSPAGGSFNEDVHFQTRGEHLGEHELVWTCTFRLSFPTPPRGFLSVCLSVPFLKRMQAGC